MVASTIERLRRARANERVNLGVKAGSQILRGCLVVAVAGVLESARAAVSRAELDTMLVVGLAADSVLGGAANGDEKVDVDKGVFCLANGGGGDALTIADIGRLCFVIDNQTVGKTVGGGARPIAGMVVDVDAAGVWVDTTHARSPRRIWLAFDINETDTLAGTSSEEISPVAGAITQLQTTVQKAVTTGGDVTAAVGVTAVAGLACTIADAAAKGVTVTDTPTLGDATTVVAVGSRIQIIPAAAFNGAGAVSGLLELTF